MMTRETKAGLAVSCTFLCLVGVVLFNKLNDKEVNGTESPDNKEMAEISEEPRPVLPNHAGVSPGPAAAFGVARATEQKAAEPGGVVPADYRAKEESLGSGSMPPAKAAKEPAANEPGTSPLSAVNAPPEGSMPAPNGSVPKPSATIGSTPAKPEAVPQAAAPRSSRDELVPDHKKDLPGLHPSRSAEPTLAQPPTSVTKEDDKPGPVVPKPESAASVVPSPRGLNEAPAAKNPAATVGSAMPAPAKMGEPADSGSRDAQPAAPLPVPGDPAASSAPWAGAGTSPTAPGAPAPLFSAGPRGPAAVEPPKARATGSALPALSKDGAAAPNMPKPQAAPAPAPTSGHEPAPQPSAWPPPVPGLAQNPQPALPRPDKLVPDEPRSDPAAPVKPQSAAGVAHDIMGSSADHKLAGSADGMATPGPAATVLAAPAANPLAPAPREQAPRSNGSSTPSPSAGPAGSSPEPGRKVGSDRGLPPSGSPSPGRDTASLQEAASILPAMPAPSGGDGPERHVPSAAPAPASARPAPSAPAAAASTMGSLSGSSSLAGSQPPLGAPALAASPPISVSVPPGAPPTQIGLSPQVESYDEDTYTCKANDTFRTISQEVYHSAQYERALLLFNRNHPLASAALRQDPPLLQTGQPVYIPPARILEKYYGAPAVAAPPQLPAAPPPAPASSRSGAAGPMQSTDLSPAGFGTSIKPVPPPDSMPVYRVPEGGEMMYEVARRTLGNGDRWAEIHRLNPGFDPKEVIPGGSQLRLPKDAHLSPPNAP